MNAKHGRLARQQARRRQRERAVGVLVVCLGVAVLVVALIALHEPKGHVTAQGSSASSVGKQSTPSSPSAGRPTSSSTPPSSSGAPRSGDANSGAAARSVPLIVLNNTTIQGLAQQASQRFEAGGWNVTRYDNYQNDIISTCAYYDPSVPGAEAAAKALKRQFPSIKRVKPRFDQLPAGPVVVVLTPDYSAG